MSTDTLIQQIREEFGSLDARGEQLVLATMKIMRRDESFAAGRHSDETFVGLNITLEEYERLSEDGKREYHDQAERDNQHWVELQLRRLSADWIMVVDGKVVMSGATLKQYPEDDVLLALCRKTGKFPFVFFDSRVFAIEESVTAWHETRRSDDAYPALPITLVGLTARQSMEADLDIGSVNCYGSRDRLIEKGIIHSGFGEVVRASSHLGRSYVCVTRFASIELVDENGITHQCRMPIICVKDWGNSPFVSINPSRQFLMGRSALLELRPLLLLDFWARTTRVSFAAQRQH